MVSSRPHVEVFLLILAIMDHKTVMQLGNLEALLGLLVLKVGVSCVNSAGTDVVSV